MDPITLQIATWLIGIIAALLSVITFFLRKIYSQFIAYQEKVTVHDAEIRLNSQHWVGHEREHTVIDKRLNSHSAQLNEHARKISVIEAKK